MSLTALASALGLVLPITISPNNDVVTMMESNNNNKTIMSEAVCDINVSIWQRHGRTIYLVGSNTSHASTTHAADVVKDVRPQAVFVELDFKSVMLGLAGGIRLSSSSSNEVELPHVTSLAGPLPIVEIPPTKVLVPTTVPSYDGTTPSHPKKIMTFAEPHIPPDFDLIRWNFLSERLFQHSHVVKTESAHPRGEAYANAMKAGLQLLDATIIILGDRDAEVTRQRTDMAWKSTAWTMSPEEWTVLQKTLRSDHDGSPEALESSVRKVKLLKRHAPKVYQAVLEERDEYMAVGLDSLKQFKTVVAVTGAVHVVGVAKHLLGLGWKPVTKNCPVP